MEKNKILIISVALIAVIIAVSAAVLVTGGGESGDDTPDVPVEPPEPTTITCKDLSGNTVVMPKEVNSMYLVGVGSLRLMSHLGLAEKVCACDQLSKGATYGSNTYMYAYDEHFNQKSVIEHSGERQKVNLEQILTCNNGSKPDVLVIADVVAADNRSTVDSIARSGVVVFEIQVIAELMSDDFRISPAYENQLTLVGKAFGVEKRAQELIDGINAIMKDVRSMSTSSGDAYIGGLTIASKRGLNLTSLDYTPFLLCGMENIVKQGNQAADAGGTSVGTQVKPEGLVKTIEQADDFIMFVDPAAWRLEKGLCASDTLISAALANKGVTKGLVLTPFHSYGMEYDNILVNSYLVAGYMNNLDMSMIREKIDGVYELFYGDHAVSPQGVKLYDEMGEWYYERTHCHFGEFVQFGTRSITMTDGTVMKDA